MDVKRLFKNTVLLVCAGLGCMATAQNFNEDWLLLRTPRAVEEESLVGRYFLNGEFLYASSSSMPVEVDRVLASKELTATVRQSVGGRLGTNLENVLTANLAQSSVSVIDVTLSELTIHQPRDFYRLDFVPATFPRRLVTGLLVAEEVNVSFSGEEAGRAQAEVERAIGQILPVEGELTFSEDQAVAQAGSNLVVAIRLVSVVKRSPINFIHYNDVTSTDESTLNQQGPIMSPNNYIASVRQLTYAELQAEGLDAEADVYCLRVEVRQVGTGAKHSRQWCPRYGHIKNLDSASDAYVPNTRDEFSDQIDLPSLSFLAGDAGSAGIIQTFLTLTSVSVEVSPTNPQRLEQVRLKASLKENRIGLQRCPPWGFPIYPKICL